MSAHTPPRQPVTTLVLAELATSGFPVGDNGSPTTPYGWQGEPGTAGQTFTPYVGLTPLTAQPQRSQTFENSQSEWIFPYSVWFAGISRVQSESLADKLRDQLINLARTVFTTPTGNWKVQQVRCTAIGANTRVGSAYPDYYTQADTVEVWVSKELA